MTRDTANSRAGQALSPAKQKLLRARLSKAVRNAEATKQIPSTNEARRFPATSPQTRFWFIDELNPGSAAYNMHVAIELSGPLNPDALRTAIEKVVDRNDVLRSTFALHDGVVWQQVNDDSKIDLTFHARSSYSEAESLLIRLARKPLSLRDGPLFCADLVELERERHMLLIVMHHIICDEPSIAILLHQIGEAYETKTVELTGEPPASFADYAKWQQKQLPELLDKQLPYWVEALQGLDDRATVPTDWPRNDRASRRGKIVRRKIGGVQLQAARALAAAEQCTLLPVMLAAWCTLLHRYTGLNDIAVGAPASQRTLAELESTVGLFLNTVVLRTKLAAKDSFRELLRAARNVTLDAFSHQDVPLQSIVGQLNPHRDKGESPFFDTMIVQESEPSQLSGFGPLTVTHHQLDAEVCKFDLTLFFRETSDGLLLSIEYDTTLYRQRRIESTLEHYISLLCQCLENPDQPIDLINYLNVRELEWLQHCSSGPWQDVGESLTVAQQIENNLCSLAEQVAIVDSRGPVTYHELNRLVSRMTDKILHMSDKPACVSILVERNRWAIAAMLASWRLGACYVPLDPGYPSARISESIQATKGIGVGDCLVVTTKRYAGLVPNDVLRVLVDTPSEVVPVRQLQDSHHETGTAYIIFTSGSSGRPKGIQITHENLRVSNEARRYVYGDAPSRFLLLSPLAFDSSVAGLFWTLAGGGTLVVADPDQVRDSREVARLVEENAITHTLLLPSLYELVLQSATKSVLQSLDTVIVAGEACPDSLLAAHTDKTERCSLYNEYGPSEATVWATVQKIDNEQNPIPIGSAIPSMRVFVLDAELQLQAPGIAGELCLSGPGLSVGYVDAAMGASTFVDLEPFGERRRIYRTGDRVRLDEEGRLLFLGRIDDQVKVRGHRVELGEIDAAIRRTGNVSDVATIFDPARQALAAFIVPTDNKSRAETVTSSLFEELPDYMVPQQLVVLDRLPRLPNGKLDLAALPEASVDTAFEEPNTEKYQALKSIWCEVLKINDCPPNVSFFDLGGHSLLAVRFLLEVETNFGRRLSLAALYDHQTLEQFYARLCTQEKEDREGAIYAIRPEGSETPLFVAGVPTKYLLSELDPQLPVFGCVKSDIPSPESKITIAQLAAGYVDAIRRQRPGPYRIAGYSFGGLLAFEIAQQLITAGHEIEQLILLDPPPPVPEGDTKFRWNRIKSRIRRAGSARASIVVAMEELSRIANRIISSIRHKIGRKIDTALAREASKASLKQANADWSKRARQNYRHEAYPYPCLLVLLGREGEETDDQQIARWNGILTGRFKAVVIHGPEDHVTLMRPPWAGKIGQAINSALDASRARLTSDEKTANKVRTKTPHQ